MELPFGLRPMLYVPEESVFLGQALFGSRSRVEGHVSLITYFSDSGVWESRQRQFSVICVVDLNIDELEESVGYQSYENRLVTLFEPSFAEELTEFLFSLTDRRPQAFFAHPWDEKLAAIKPFSAWMNPDYVILRVKTTIDHDLREIESMLFEVEAYMEYQNEWKGQPTEFLIAISDAQVEFASKNRGKK